MTEGLIKLADYAPGNYLLTVVEGGFRLWRADAWPIPYPVEVERTFKMLNEESDQEIQEELDESDSDS
jgi:hypothetical protein